MAAQTVEQIAENLYRVREFHEWVRSNTMFPTVPDSIVNPLKDQLRLAEHALLTALYDQDAIQHATAIQKAMLRNVHTNACV